METIETKELIKELRKSYNKRPRGEKHLSFGQFIRLEELRSNRKEEIKEARKKIEYQQKELEKKNFKLNDRVNIYVKFDNNKRLFGGKRLVGGTIKRIKKNGNYDVSTNIGLFTNIGIIYKRYFVDLSHIEVPKKIKKVSTHKLLKLFRMAKSSTYGYWDDDSCYMSETGEGQVWFEGKHYDSEVLQAELNTREHVFKEDEKRFLRKNKTQQK